MQNGWVQTLAVVLLCGWMLPMLYGEDRPLRIGMELGYPPFEMIDADGKPEGVSVEMSKALGQFLKREVVIENMAFDGLIPALKSGKIDLIISSMTANEERRRAIDFSEPYVKTGLALLVGKASEAEGIEDLDHPGKRIAVKRGTTGHLYAMDRLQKANLLVLDKENAAVLEVLQGKADAFIYDQLSIYNHWNRNKESTRAILKPFQQEVWAVGLRQGEDGLREQVNAFLAFFRESGGFEALADRFFKDEREVFKQLGTEFLF